MADVAHDNSVAQDVPTVAQGQAQNQLAQIDEKEK